MADIQEMEDVKEKVKHLKNSNARSPLQDFTNRINIRSGGSGGTTAIASENISQKNNAANSHTSTKSIPGNTDRHSFSDSSNASSIIQAQYVDSDTDTTAEFESVSDKDDQIPKSSDRQSMHSVLKTELNTSEAGPITADQELSRSELFQDASSLDFEYLSSVGKTSSNVPEALVRESLYVKFDPIVERFISNTGNMPLPPQGSGDQEFTPPRNNSKPEVQKTPGHSPAVDTVQKLISLTPPNSSTAKSEKPSTSPASSPRVQDKENQKTRNFIPQDVLEKELQKLQDVMIQREVVYEETLSKMESDYKTEISKSKDLQKKLDEMTDKETKLNKELQDKTKSKQQLSLIMEEYEKTISQLVAQKEEEKKEFEIQKERIISERDLVMQHLNNSEIAFNDVHVKYERSKTVIEGMKNNEDLLKKSLNEYEEAIKQMKDKYDTLKNHAVQQLDKANQELDMMRRAHQAEVAKLKAMLKKSDITNNSLKESLEQKTKENQELTSICDELINKVN